MKIALIGSTGFVGRHLRRELLSRGHAVTAIVSSRTAPEPEEGLTIVQADVYDAGAVADAVRGHDVVLSAFNAGWQNPNLYDDFLRGSDAIVAGTEAGGVRRLLVIAGAGSLYVAPGVQLVDTPQFADHVPAFVLPGARAARDALTKVHANKTLDWTFLSPPALLEEGERTGEYRLGGNDLLLDGDRPAGISVPDLAVAAVDEIETPRHRCARFTVASKN